MSIKRILLLASMALAAIAFAAPAAAQAEVLLTDEEGTPLAFGADVTATSTNLETVTSAGTLKCKKVTLHFEVKTNGETDHVILDPVGEATTEGCSAGLAPVTINDGTVLTPLTIDTWGTGWAGATFGSKVFKDAKHTELALSCNFSGVIHVEGVQSGTDNITVGPSVLAGVGTGCSNGTMSGEFTLETEGGETVLLDYVETE